MLSTTAPAHDHNQFSQIQQQQQYEDEEEYSDDEEEEEETESEFQENQDSNGDLSDYSPDDRVKGYYQNNVGSL